MRYGTEDNRMDRSRSIIGHCTSQEGAAGLAAFAEGLSEEGVAHTGAGSGGMAVRSVSSCITSPAVYPIEIDLAPPLASRKAVTGVTWMWSLS